MIPIKILAILLLAGAVTKFGHPLRAAVVFGALMGGLELAGGTAFESAAIRAAGSFTVAAIAFWLIDRTQSILLGMVVTIAGVVGLVLFG